MARSVQASYLFLLRHHTLLTFTRWRHHMLLTMVHQSGYRPVWLALFTYLLNIARDRRGYGGGLCNYYMSSCHQRIRTQNKIACILNLAQMSPGWITSLYRNVLLECKCKSCSAPTICKGSRLRDCGMHERLQKSGQVEIKVVLPLSKMFTLSCCCNSASSVCRVSFFISHSLSWSFTFCNSLRTCRY